MVIKVTIVVSFGDDKDWEGTRGGICGAETLPTLISVISTSGHYTKIH